MTKRTEAQRSPFIVEIQPLNFLFSANIRLFSSVFNKMHYADSLFDLFGIAMPVRIEKAMVARKAEYLAGRYVAKQALKSLGEESLDIPQGKKRNPIWPKEIVGSITHKSAKALSAVAYRQNVTYIGLDYEYWIQKKTEKNIKESIISEREYHLLKHGEMDYAKGFTLAFSAKESLYKALYSQVNQYFDFLAVELTFISSEQQYYELTLRKTLTPQHKAGMMYSGYFIHDSFGILTIIFGLEEQPSSRLLKFA